MPDLRQVAQLGIKHKVEGHPGAAACALVRTDVSPAHGVRGPKYPDTLTGLRDRALIGLMVYTFARVGAALRMRVEDHFVQGHHGWVRLHEKGGASFIPCPATTIGCHTAIPGL